MEFSEVGLDDFLKELRVKSQAPIVPQGQISKREYKRIMQRNVASKVQSQQETPIEIEAPKRKAVSTPNSQESAPREILSQKLQVQAAEVKRSKSPYPEEVVVQFNSLQEKKEILKIFQSKTFVFIPYGIAFTKKQIDILSENIRKRGGKTFEFGIFDWKPLSYFELMIITSNQMPHKVLLETVTEKYHKNLDDFVFVDFGWIAKCIQENSLLDHGVHTIQWVIEVEVEIEAVKKPARDIYATRHQLKGGNNNKRLKRNVGDTEALDLYLEEEKLELEALALESELIRYPIKKMKKNVQVLETCRFLYDYSVGGHMRLVVHEDNQIMEVHRELPKDTPKKYSPPKDFPQDQLKVQIEEEPSSPKTEILSVSDEELIEVVEVEEIEPDMKDYTKRLAFTQKMEVEEGETQAMSVFGAKISPDIKVCEEYDESLMPKQEFVPNYFVLDSDDDEEEDENSGFQFIEPIKNNKEVNKVKNYNDPMLKGVEMQDEVERVKQYKTFNPLTKGKAQYWDKKKNFFVCEVGTVANHNTHITTELEKLQRVYTNEKDNGRMFAYRKALAIIKSVPFKIESPEDINNITGIGKKIKDKIQEIVSTGKLKKAEILTKDIKQVTIEILTQVWGIGVQTAIELFHKGLRTIDDLRRNTDLLNDNQKIGLKYFDDLQKRMSREEVTGIVKIVEAKIEELAEDKLIFEVICCGSYRRGKPTCGDIDILITRRDGKSFTGFLQKLVKSLEGNLLTDHLMWPKPGSNGNETYMGICKNGGLNRRIDIKIYPREQFGYAVLYFTGNDYFNRSMRLFARKKGMTLSDHGLCPSLRNKQEKVWTGQNIPCFTEEEVFNVLGLTYRPPSEREV